MKRLALLVVGVKWPPESFIWRRLVQLSAKGVEVSVATPTPGARPISTAPDVRPIPIPDYRASIASTVPRLVAQGVASAVRSARGRSWMASALRRGPTRANYSELRRFLPLIDRRPDVVHFEWITAAIDHLPLWSVWNVPVVVSCRGTQVNVRALAEPELAMRMRDVFARATAVHCVSRAIRDVAVPLGLEPAKAVVIPPAVDPSVFSPASAPRRPDGVFRIAAIGSWTWPKGHEYMLLAIRGLLDRGIRAKVVIVGTGPDHQRLRFTINDLGLDDHVELVGALAPKDVVATLRTCDALVLASVSEGISNAVLEAMACGLPVVTTDCGGMREVVDDGVEGYVVPVRDPHAMTGALERLAAEPRARAEMGNAGRRRIESAHMLSAQTEQFLQLYDRIRA